MRKRTYARAQDPRAGMRHALVTVRVYDTLTRHQKNRGTIAPPPRLGRNKTLGKTSGQILVPLGLKLGRTDIERKKKISPQ